MNQPKVRNEPRWERRKDARPTELIDAALELFAEKGYAATRLDDVAARAGVSKGTLYLYFESKEDLFKAVVRSAIVPAIQDAERLVDHFEGGAADLLRQIILGWWNFIGTGALSAIPKLIVCEARNFPEIADFYYDEVVSRGKSMFARALRRGMESGEFRALDIECATRVLMSPLLMRCVWQHSLAACEREQPDPDTYFETYLGFALAGLKNHEAAAA